MRASYLPVAGLVLLVAFSPSVSAAQAQQQQDPPASDQAQPSGVVVTLDDMVLAALQRNLDLQTRRTENLIVATAVQRAESTFDPALDLDPQVSFGSSNVFDSTDGSVSSLGATAGSNSFSLSGTLPFSTAYSASLSSSWIPERGSPLFTNTLTMQLSQPLLRGRGRSIARAEVEGAILDARSSDQSLLREVETLIADVETSYWLLGLREAIEANARQSVSRAQELLERNRQLAELELLADADLVSARAGVQSRLTILTDASRAREDAVDTLLFLVYGREASEQIRALGLDIRTTPPSGDVPELPDLITLEQRALDARHDVQAAQYDIRSSQVSLQSAENALLPQLDLVGGYTALTEDVDTFALYQVTREIDIQFDGFTAGALLTYSFRNNAAEANRASARLGVERNQLELSSVQNVVRSEVRSAARAVSYGSRRLQEAQQSAQLEQQRYENGEQQLRLGLIDTFRLLQYEEDATVAELTASQALYELANAVTRYQLAIGELDEKYVPGGAPAQIQ